MSQTEQITNEYDQIVSVHCRPMNISLRFKGMILKSIIQKHRNKQIKCMKRAFYQWYISKKDNQLMKNMIDKILISQKNPKFSQSNFFYRLKYFIRFQLQKSSKQSCSSNNKNTQESHIEQRSFKKKITIVDDNLSEYFQSLKHIFSMKVVQIESSNISIEKQHKPVNINTESKYKKCKYKTEGCEKQENTKNQSDFSNKYQNLKIQRELSILKVQKANNLKSIGIRMSLTLMKNTLITTIKKRYFQALFMIKIGCKVDQLKQKQKQDFNKVINQLQSINNASLNSSNQSMIDKPFISKQEKLIKRTSSTHSQASSLLSIPSVSALDSQINQVQYTIKLLSQTMKKDKQIDQLHEEFQQQYKEFQHIQKQFQFIRIKTKNKLFQKLNNFCKTLLFSFKKQAFECLNQYAARSKSKSFSKSDGFNILKSFKQVDNRECVSKSRVNIQTLKDIFSKSLIKVPNMNNSQICIQNQSKQNSITSIRFINNQNTQKINKKEVKQLQNKSVRSGIRRQNITSKDLTFKKNIYKSILQIQQSNHQICKTAKQTKQKKRSDSDECYYKSHVNFLLPFQLQIQNQKYEDKSQNSQNKTNLSVIKKKSLIKLEQFENKQNDINFQQKQIYKKSQNLRCELSLRSLQSVQSSETKKYHANIKSQYWWKNQENEKLKFTSKQTQNDKSMISRTHNSIDSQAHQSQSISGRYNLIRSNKSFERDDLRYFY